MTSYGIRCTRTTFGSALLLATACCLAAAVPGAMLATARPAVAATPDGGGLLEPTPLILKDGRIAHVSIHLIPFEQSRADLAEAAAGRLSQLSRGIATDCFLTAQVIGHVEPNEVEGGDTLGAHRLARSRADRVQGALVDGGLPAKAIASVWDWQFLVREPRVTLWLFRLSEGEDCEGAPLRPDAAAPQVASSDAATPGPAAAATTTTEAGQRTQVADAAAGAEPASPAATEAPAAARGGASTPAPAAERATDSLPMATVDASPPAAPAVQPAPSRPAPVPPPQDIRTTEVTPPSTAAGDAAETAIGTQARAITPDRELMAVVAPRGDSPTTSTAARAEPGAQPAPAGQQAVQPPAQAQPPATAAARVEPPAEQPADAAAGAPGEPVRVTFPVNSSYFDEDGRRELAALIRNIREGQRYRVQLTAAVGTGDVQGASQEDSVRYNRWLATRRLERVQEWLQENARAEFQIEPSYREDPSRQVEVRVTPAG